MDDNEDLRITMMIMAVPDHFFFPGRKDTQVPECPSARLEMLDLRVGVPECPSARPLFFSWKVLRW